MPGQTMSINWLTLADNKIPERSSRQVLPDSGYYKDSGSICILLSPKICSAVMILLAYQTSNCRYNTVNRGHARYGCERGVVVSAVNVGVETEEIVRGSVGHVVRRPEYSTARRDIKCDK